MLLEMGHKKSYQIVTKPASFNLVDCFKQEFLDVSYGYESCKVHHQFAFKFKFLRLKS